MVFDLIANSFWATLLLFSALIYAIFAQAVTGAKLYRDHARQYQVIASPESSPVLREIVAGRVHGRWLRKGLVPSGALALTLWMIGTIGHMAPEAVAPTWLAIRDSAFCAIVSLMLAGLAAQIRTISAFRAMKLSPPTGQIHLDATYGRSVLQTQCLVEAMILAAVALFAPSPVTIGFALGPLLLALGPARAARAQRRSADKAQVPGPGPGTIDAP